jgi:transcriptional regulator with XRE-family HTH domain
VKEIVFDSYVAWHKFLQDRREQLGLSIRDMEAISGLADDHLAKIESGVKIPNLETAIMLSQAAGIELFARYSPLRKLAKRTIIETRAQLQSRETMQKHHAERRRRKRASDDQST